MQLPRRFLHSDLVLSAKTIDSLSNQFCRIPPFPLPSFKDEVDVELGADFVDKRNQVATMDNASHLPLRLKSFQQRAFDLLPKFVGVLPTSLQPEETLLSSGKRILLPEKPRLGVRRQVEMFFDVLPLLWSCCRRRIPVLASLFLLCSRDLSPRNVRRPPT